MPLTDKTVQKAVPAGVIGTFTDFDETNGMKFRNDGHTVFVLNNGSAGPVDLVFESTKEVDGLAVADVESISVPAGDIAFFSGFKQDVFNQTATEDAGSVKVTAGTGTFDANVTCAVIRG